MARLVIVVALVPKFGVDVLDDFANVVSTNKSFPRSLKVKVAGSDLAYRPGVSPFV